jgi:hypothetical protein
LWILMVWVSVDPCRAVAGALAFAARSTAGVMASPSDPLGGNVTVAGARGVILPVAGLRANWDRTPSFSLVT